MSNWYNNDIPIGVHHPDWALVKESNREKILYLVRETKGTKDFEKLRNSEAYKIRCGKKHFKSLDVDYKVVVSADEVK